MFGKKKTKMTPAPVRAYVAEIAGTFLLTGTVLLAGVSGAPTPVMAALALGVAVYCVGSVSGAHINPAITLSLLAVGKVNYRDAVGYILAQCIGALAAVLVGYGLVGEGMATVAPENTPLIGAAEAVGAFVLAFGVSSVVYGRTQAAASGITIGLSLLLGIVMASTVSAGILNPAVAVALGATSVAYLVGPIVGALLGMLLGKYLQS